MDSELRALDAVEALVIPPDPGRALADYPHAAANFAAFRRAAKRGMLEWIMQAKRVETRPRRVGDHAVYSTHRDWISHPDAVTPR